MTQQNTHTYVETPLDNRACTIWGKPWITGERASPLAKWTVYNNNPRLTFRLNHPEEINTPNEKVPLSARFDMVYATMFRNMAEEIIDKGVENSFSIQNNSYVKGEGTKVDNILTFGRDESLTCYIEIKKEGRPVVRINWEESFFHKVLNKQGNPITKGLISGQLAKAWFKVSFDAIEHIMVNDHTPNSEIRARIDAYKNKVNVQQQQTATNITSDSSF